MDNDGKINISFLIIFVGLLLVLMVYPLVIANPINFWNLDSATAAINYSSAVGILMVNEDVETVYNITLNNSAAWKGNVTRINITFYGNFVYANFSNHTGMNLTTPGSNIDVGIIFYNASDGSSITWTNNSTTQVVIPHANLSFSNVSISFNATSFTPGKYNFSIYTYWNGSLAHYNETNVTVVVNDTTKPISINVSSNLNASDFGLNRSYANVSGRLYINVTVFDNGNFSRSNVDFNEIKEVNVTVYTSASVVNASYNMTALTNFSNQGTQWNTIINTSQFDDGVYNISLFAKDQLGNVNSTNISNVRIDNTKPTASVSCTPATANVGDTVTCTCSPTDPTSGVNTSITSITEKPSTSNTGTFTESCTFGDMAGNTATASSTFTVELGGSGGGGGGGGGGAGSVEVEAAKFYTKTIPVVAQEFKEVETITQQLGSKERIKIKIDEEIHYVGVREITLTSAIIEVASEPVQVELQSGEDTKVDVNDDGFYDVYVKLNAIINGKADLIIKYLHEEYTPAEEPGIEPGEEETAPTEEGEKANLTWLWILIAVVVIVIVAYLVWKRKR